MTRGANEGFQERPTRYEYHLTEKGYDAAQVLFALMVFGERWSFEDEEPVRLYDRRTGARVRPRVVDAVTGEPLDPRQLYAGPGPSFPPNPELRARRFAEFFARED